MVFNRHSKENRLPVSVLNVLNGMWFAQYAINIANPYADVKKKKKKGKKKTTYSSRKVKLKVFQMKTIMFNTC